jgi:hypothetical protein
MRLSNLCAATVVNNKEAKYHSMLVREANPSISHIKDTVLCTSAAVPAMRRWYHNIHYKCESVI